MVEISSERDFYSILEVNCDAPRSAIRDAYKRLALLVHPDKSSSCDATASFQRLGRAWETLKDAKKRDAYDRSLEEQRRESQVDAASRKQHRKRKRDDDDREVAALEAERQARAEVTRLAELKSLRRQAEIRLTQIEDEQVYMLQRAKSRELHSRYAAQYLEWAKKWSAFRQRPEVTYNMKEIELVKVILEKQRKELATFQLSAEREVQEWERSYPKGYLVHLKEAHIGRRLVYATLMRAFQNRIDLATTNLQEIASELLNEESSLRKGMAEEASNFLEDPVWKRIHGDSIHARQSRFWRLLKNLKLTARLFVRAESECVTHLPWKLEHRGPWIKIPISDDLCGRCDQPTSAKPKHLHYEAHTYKCTHCQLLLCADCGDKIRTLIKWEDWLGAPFRLDNNFASRHYPLL